MKSTVTLTLNVQSVTSMILEWFSINQLNQTNHLAVRLLRQSEAVLTILIEPMRTLEDRSCSTVESKTKVILETAQ